LLFTHAHVKMLNTLERIKGNNSNPKMHANICIYQFIKLVPKQNNNETLFPNVCYQLLLLKMKY